MASKNTSIALGAPYVAFAKQKVESGEFGSTSEVVREAMRRYVVEQTEIDAVRLALIEAENSGPTKPWNLDAFLKERRRSA
jgi:antitoxin ParD1/3/4